MNDINTVLTACLQSSTKLESTSLSINSGAAYELDPNEEQLSIQMKSLNCRDYRRCLVAYVHSCPATMNDEVQSDLLSYIGFVHSRDRMNTVTTATRRDLSCHRTGRPSGQQINNVNVQ